MNNQEWQSLLEEHLDALLLQGVPCCVYLAEYFSACDFLDLAPNQAHVDETIARCAERAAEKLSA